MNFKCFEEIIAFAIDKEEEAVAFYEEAAEQEPYSGAKKTFEEFAGEERKHASLLEGVLRGETRVSEYELKRIPDLKRSDYLVDMTYEEGMPYADILRLAMKREEKSLKLYNSLADRAEKEDLLKLFRMLSQEEAKHKLAIETLYDDYMAEQGD
ncbi:MAG: ferritin family protein [Deltaproteobacteria bacterium]|nr:ferritin family protein [Deltaproteobacteria bacterium]MBW2138284.1 ferritin family protein [Deltaproteobacteria bacterium]